MPKSTLQTALLFLLAGLTGWSVFNLQVVSLVRLIEGAGIAFLPVMMIVQAGLSWGVLRLWGKSVQGSPRQYFVTGLLGGAVLTVVALPPVMGVFLNFGVPAAWAYGSLFIMSQLIIAALRMGIHITFSRKISVLSNPQISTQLAIAEESGLMVGVMTSFLSMSLKGVLPGGLLGVLPFALGIGVYLSIESSAPKPVEAVEVPEKKMRNIAGRDRRPAFFMWMIGLFAIVASLKSLQWFGMAYGLSEAHRQGLQLMSLFSWLAFVQSALTLTILVASLRFSSKIPTWGLGFRILLLAQGGLGILLGVAPYPFVLMGGEIFRKVLEHGFLGRSLQLLTSTLPSEQRFESRHFMERWSTTSGTFIAGVLALLTLHGALPTALLWGTATFLAVVGLAWKRRLFEALCDFHVARLRLESLEGVLQACQALGNPDCKHHYAALTSLLGRQPRPVILKSILRALGRMGHPTAVPALLSQLHSRREDIQLAAVQALNHYRGHEINFILLKLLRESVRSALPMKISVIHRITQRLDRLVVPYLVEVLESEPDERVAANAVEILGEVAQSEKDEDLKDYIAKFLDARYPRRVRANAVAVLYRHRVHRARALETFDSFLTSEDPKELDAAAYLAGVLQLKGHEEYVWQRSLREKHTNTTCLVSLLRLGNPIAARLLAEWIAGNDEARAREALARLSVLPPTVRARVFYQVIERCPDAISLVFTRLRESQRDFETDRDLIREEVQRVGLHLVEEDPEFVPKAA